MAHPIHRMVLDLSHHNLVQDLDAVVQAGIVGIIHKATEGDYNVDGKYPGRRAGFLEKGLLWGAYHFATSDPVGDQVDWFLKYAAPDRETLVVLDWEPYGNKTMSESQAREWIKTVEQRLGRPNEVVIYSGNQAKETLGSRVDPFFGARRLWLAQYGSSPVCQASWSTFWLWQYSDGQAGPQPHGCPGVTGYVDTNSYDYSEQQLRKEWAGPTVGPAEEELVVTITINAPPGVKIIVNTE